MNNINELDLDIIKLIIIIYKEKWKVIIITILSLLIAICYSIYNKPKFETEIEYNTHYSFDLSPTVIDGLLFSSFYSLDIFSNWKKTSSNKILKFEEISNTININGLLFKKSNNENLIELNNINTNRSITIKTNQIDLIKSIYSYLEFVNEFITNIYREELLSDLENVSDLYADVKTNQTVLDQEDLKIKKLLSKIENGKLLIEFRPPSKTKLVSIPTTTILFFSVIVGFLFSIFFIFFIKFIKKINRELVKKEYF